MSKLRIVIAVEEPVFSEALRALLAPHGEFDVVSEVRDEPTLAATLHNLLSRTPIAPDDVLVVIASLASGSTGASAYSRLLLEFPDIIVYDVESHTITRYRACIEARHLPGSLDSLITDLQSISSQGLSPLQVVRPGSQELDQ